MIDDLLAISKYAVLFFGSFYGYFKLAKVKFRLINILDILVTILFSAALYYATKQIRILIPLGFLLITCLYIILRVRHSILNTVIICVISCGITVITMAFAFIVSIPVGYITFLISPNDTLRGCVVIAATDLLHLIFVYLIYRIKRFKSGISIRHNDGNIELLLLISIFSIFLMTIFYADSIAHTSFEIIVLTLIFCGLGLIIWWKKYVTNNYIKKVYKRNGFLYEHRIEEYERELSELSTQNRELSKIIHRDNKLIPAMVMAVKELIGNAPDNPELKGLLEQLEELADEHREIIGTYQAKADTLPKTNCIPIDAVLHYLLSRAKQSGVEFKAEVNDGCISVLVSKMTEMTDLTTILCDLGENAVIATKNISEGKILITFGLSGTGEPQICIYDNGPQFDGKVIANMGERRITTHKIEGGNGIGLMTLFEILSKYNASFCLDERQSNVYSKCIKIAFDGLHKIQIFTERDNIKKLCAARSDLLINQ